MALSGHTYEEIALLQRQMLHALLSLGGSAGNNSLRGQLGWDDNLYEDIRDRLVHAGHLQRGKGRGGSVRVVGSTAPQPHGNAGSDPCTELRRISSYVSGWVEAQSSVGEESLTDWLLFNASQSIPQMRYWKFTRKEEGQLYGADWDWCIVTSRRAYTFRVQAKRAPRNKDLYSALSYSNSYGLQIEMLIESAKIDNALPLYAIYPDPTAGVGIGCVPFPMSRHGTGVCLVSAAWINDTFVQPARRKVNVMDVLKKSIPLECMACCGLVPHDFTGFVRRYFTVTESGSALDRNLLPGVTEYPPAWAEWLLKSEVTGDARDWWDRDFGHLASQKKVFFVWDVRD